MHESYTFLLYKYAIETNGADSTHHPKWQLNWFMHFHTTMQQIAHWLQGRLQIHPQNFPFDNNHPI